MRINIADVQGFHGHLCPGLAIGVRVAEQALLEMGERPGDEEVIAIVETDNCAVDAVQFITGCTFGKGNLIHLDYGKNAFRFIRRSDGKAVRIVVKADTVKSSDREIELVNRLREGTACDADRQEADQLRRQRIDRILSAPLDSLVSVQPVQPEIPPRARIFHSVACAGCGELTMETRLRLLEGKAYCPECFENQING